MCERLGTSLFYEYFALNGNVLHLHWHRIALAHIFRFSELPYKLAGGCIDELHWVNIISPKNYSNWCVSVCELATNKLMDENITNINLLNEVYINSSTCLHFHFCLSHTHSLNVTNGTTNRKLFHLSSLEHAICIQLEYGSLKYLINFYLKFRYKISIMNANGEKNERIRATDAFFLGIFPPFSVENQVCLYPSVCVSVCFFLTARGKKIFIK